MFLVVQRTDTLPEMRALVSTDHAVAVMPVAGGVRTRLYLSNGDASEDSLPFSRAGTVFREEVEPGA